MCDNPLVEFVITAIVKLRTPADTIEEAISIAEDRLEESEHVGSYCVVKAEVDNPRDWEIYDQEA